MWLGRQSITALAHYLDGIRRAEIIYQIPEDRRLCGFPFDEFEEWVAARHNHEQMSIGSFRVALLRVGANEAAVQDVGHIGVGLDKVAFHLWFAWYDQFRQKIGGTEPP